MGHSSVFRGVFRQLPTSWKITINWTPRITTKTAIFSCLKEMGTFIPMFPGLDFVDCNLELMDFKIMGWELFVSKRGKKYTP